jgi:uncharacterized membrane protein
VVKEYGIPREVPNRLGLILAGLLAKALSAGFFYTYAVSVMPGLAAADPSSAIRAVQGINAVIRTPVFAFAFFGSLLFPLAVALAASIGRARQVAVLAFLSATLYGPGVFAVTFLVNVPLNEALAGANPTSDTAARIWANYYGPWTTWNHVRAVCACLAFGLFAAAAVVHFRRPTSGLASSNAGRTDRP